MESMDCNHRVPWELYCPKCIENADCLRQTILEADKNRTYATPTANDWCKIVEIAKGNLP